jgi:hypothetical protein
MSFPFSPLFQIPFTFPIGKMGERKVLNKYFPPDFDPNLVPRTKFDKFKQIETRMMIPFNIQCDTCGEFMYRGKKFNMR